MFFKSIKKLSILSCVFFFILTLPAYSFSGIKKGDILSLDECIKIGIKNNPNIQISKNNIKLSSSKVGQAKSDYFPNIGASGGYFGNNTFHDNFTGHDYYYTAGVSLRQLIFNFGKTAASIKIQEFNKIASQFDYDYTVLQTAYNVKNAYYTVLAAQAKIDIAKSNLEINKRQFAQIKAFFEEGIKSKIDFVNAQVNMSNSEIELITAETEYENALVKLNNSMYVAYAPEYSIKNTETFNFKQNWADVKFLNIGNYKKLEEEINSNEIEMLNYTPKLTSKVEKDSILNDYTFKPYIITFEEALDSAKENRPDFKSYLAAKEAMVENLKYVKKEYFPELSANAGYSWKNTEQLTSNGFNYSASLDISTTNAMRTKYRVEEANVQLEIAKENINLIEKNIFFEVQDAYIKLVQYEKQIPLYKKKVNQALENFKLADGRYGTGLANFIELQDARSQYLNSEQEYVQIIYNYNTAKAKLEAAMGVI